MKNKVRLSESQLYNIIKESVKSILMEYDWNGRTPEQDKASIVASNQPASWKQHMLRAQQQQQQGRGYNRDLVKKANDAFHNKYGTKYDYYEDNFENGGKNSNMIRGNITGVNTTGGRLAFNQRDRGTNGERYHEKTYGDMSSQNMNGITDNDFRNGYANTYVGNRNVWGQQGNASESLRNSGEEAPSTRNKRYLSMSPQFNQRLTDMDNNMEDFYSGNYNQRLQSKKSQLGNQGRY